jgi:hypothetical protein
MPNGKKLNAEDRQQMKAADVSYSLTPQGARGRVMAWTQTTGELIAA